MQLLPNWLFAVIKLSQRCYHSPFKAVIKLLSARATSPNQREDTKFSQTGQYVEIPRRDPSPLHAAPQWPPVKSSCLPDLVDTKVKSDKWAKKMLFYLFLNCFSSFLFMKTFYQPNCHLPQRILTWLFFTQTIYCSQHVAYRGLKATAQRTLKAISPSNS